MLGERKIEVQTKYVSVPPTFLPDVQAPTLSKEEIVVMTPEEAQYLSDACYDLKAGTALENEYNGLDVDSACFWSISGYTSQGWYNFQENLILLGAYTEQLRSQLEFYKQQLRDRHLKEE